MSSSLFGLEPTVDVAVLERIANDLRHVGWVVIDDALPRPAIAALRSLAMGDDTEFARAGIGRDDDFVRADEVRRDRISWLDPDDDCGAWYFSWAESLRAGLNRSLFLGLFDYECHLAWYRAGGFYAAHVDAFRGDDNRKVSTVLYLNDDWQPADGGELVLYDPIPADAEFDPAEPHSVTRIVTPTAGTLVCFLSEELPHEVLPAAADRLSVAGWFRINASGRRVDPPLFVGAL